MNKSKPLIGILLIGVGAVLIYIGWKGLSKVTSYVQRKIP